MHARMHALMCVPSTHAHPRHNNRTQQGFGTLTSTTRPRTDPAMDMAPAPKDERLAALRQAMVGR